MPRISEALGVTKMALYCHVPSKAVLLALMADEAMRMPEGLKIDPADWRTSLSFWAHGFAGLLMQHGWVLQVTQGPRPVGPTEVLWIEKALACQEHARLAGPSRLDTVAAIAGLVRGVVQQQLASPRMPEGSLHLLLALRDASKRSGDYAAFAAAICEGQTAASRPLTKVLRLFSTGLNGTCEKASRL